MTEGDKGWCVLLCTLILSVLVSGCFASDSFTDKCYTGVFVEGGQQQIDRVHNFEELAGIKVSQVMWFVDWIAPFPVTDCQRLEKKKYIPNITWEPWYWGGDGVDLKEITDGKFDDYLEEWVKGVKKYGGPVFIRWAHEFNGDWYPWSLHLVGPEQYAKTFRYIVNFFRARGADNVKWIWCPNTDRALPPQSYPGAEYVDWIGVDIYNFGAWSKDKGWEGFDRLFYNTYKLLRGRYPEKPIMIGEMGCAQKGGDKASWIKEFGSALKNRYPGVLSFVWFNIHKEADWRIESSSVARAAFMEVVSDSRYSGDHKGLWAVPADALDGMKDLWGSNENRPKVPLYKLKKKRFDAVIDGSLDEWKKVGTFDIKERSNIVIGPAYWKSAKDLSARAMIVWDEKGLYLGVCTDDDKPFINFQDDSKIWNGDCVELCLGMNPDADFSRMDFEPTDFQIGFALKPGATRVALWRGQGQRDGIQAIAKACKNGCDLEAFLPWQALGVKDPKALIGKRLRLNLALDDADEAGGERRLQMTWAGGADFYLFPCLWGEAEIEM